MYVGSNGIYSKGDITVNSGNISQDSNGYAEFLSGVDASGTVGSGTGAGTVVGIQVVGNYMYVIKGGVATNCSSAIGCELQIYDITDPKNPVYLGGADASGSTNSGTSAVAFNAFKVVGRYLYTVQGSSSSTCSATPGSAEGCEFKGFDRTDPSAPAYIGGADASGSTNSGTGSQSFWGIMSGNYAFITAYQNSTTCSATRGSAIGCELKVYKISSASEPLYVGGADVSGSSNSGTGYVAIKNIQVQNGIAYTISAGSTTACNATAGNAIGCEYKIFDVINESNKPYPNRRLGWRRLNNWNWVYWR